MMEKLAKSVKTEIGDLTAGMELSDEESDFACELISLLKRNAERYIEVAKELPEVK
jgi:ABC-type Zn uptake system ZnuABC Zn-binding protein ZnuA